METYLNLPTDNINLKPTDNANAQNLPDLSQFLLRCNGCTFTAPAGSAGLQLAIMHDQRNPEDCVKKYDRECGGWEIL